jgi:hypothetical protein
MRIAPSRRVLGGVRRRGRRHDGGQLRQRQQPADDHRNTANELVRELLESIGEHDERCNLDVQAAEQSAELFERQHCDGHHRARRQSADQHDNHRGLVGADVQFNEQSLGRRDR